MYTAGEKIKPRYIEEEMKDSYINYSMSVIVGRALPDVRDGLKPVHRRILYAMNDLGLEHSKPYKKSARIVGETLGKYHPHGDTAVYDSLVRMAQDFSLRYPLIDGQGNFGSVDGDAPAAMRYTEARLARISGLLLEDLEKETVDFVPNFDGSLNEPVILPSVLPNLLINGSSGIAVGMATNVPPHNLKEVADGIVFLIDNPQAEIKELMKIIKGPDFPTGGIICGTDGIKEAYLTGKGKLKLTAKAFIEEQKNGKETIIVTEIPYQSNKANIIESIANLVNDKKIEGISDIRDESDKDGMRIVIEIKRGENARVVLNQLSKHTQLQSTFGIIMLALVDGRPKTLNLKQLLSLHIDHRKNIIKRRTRYELDKAEQRIHILEGLKKAIEHLNQVIKTIKESKTPKIAKENLMKQFAFSEKQAQAILEMQLQRLTALEVNKLEEEYAELLKKIEYYKQILKDERKVLDLIKEELAQLKEKYGDERRTDIVKEEKELEIEDLIAEEDMVITMSHSGYIKRSPVSAYRRQKRGGKGITAAGTKEEDFIESLFIASTHDHLLFFTTAGRLYWLKVHQIPEASRVSKGKPIVNMLELAADEKTSSFIPVREFSDDKFIVMITSQGVIKKTNLSAFSNPRKGGILAVTLEKNDKLVSTKLTDGKKEILISTKNGKAIRFKEDAVRDMGRAAKGVRAIKLNPKDCVISMEVVDPEAALLTITEKGFGKRTFAKEYRMQSRGGKGIINIKITDKNSYVIGVLTVADEDELMIITSSGMMVRCAVKDIRTVGRATQGVKVISLKDKDKVVGVAKVVAKEDEEESET